MSTSNLHPHRNLYLREIEEAFEVLESLKNEGFYNVPKITWWILKHEDLYDYSYNHRHVNSCFDGMSCCCTDKNPESRFSTLYTSLEEVVDLHSHENYFKKEINTFEKIQNFYPALMQWLKKNEKLGTEDFCFFWIEWLDDEKTIVNPWIMKEQSLGIKFRAEEWQHTIRFLKVFNEIYWTSEACPPIN